MNRVKGLLNVKGYTLIEVLVVVAIIGILSALAVPSMIGRVNETRANICASNCMHLGRMYQSHLEIGELKHSSSLLEDFISEYKKKSVRQVGLLAMIIMDR